MEGTATRGAGNDYTLSSTSLIFGTSDATKTVTITALDDVVDDNDETIILSVDAGTIDGVDAGTPTSVMVTITDDDDPMVSLSLSDTTIAETGGTSTLTVTLSSEPAQSTNITIDTAGSAVIGAGNDYTLTPARSRLAQEREVTR